MIIIVVSLIIGCGIGVSSQPLPQPKPSDTWRKLLEIDNKMFSVNADQFNYCGQGITAVRNQDVYAITQVTDKINAGVIKFTELTDERNLIIKDLKN